jgi:PAS domain S-box-containing protein
MKRTSVRIYAIVAAYVVCAVSWIVVSDRMLAGIDDGDLFLTLAMLKGVLFVLLSAALFLFVLRHLEEAGPATQLGRSGLWSRLAVLLAICATVGLVATVVYRAEKRRAVDDMVGDMQTSANFAAGSLRAWLDGRYATIRIPAGLPPVVDAAVEDGAATSTACTRARAWVDALDLAEEIGGLDIVGRSGRVVCSIGDPVLVEHPDHRVDVAGLTGGPTIETLRHRDGSIRFLLTVPIRPPHAGDVVLGAAVVELPIRGEPFTLLSGTEIAPGSAIAPYALRLIEGRGADELVIFDGGDGSPPVDCRRTRCVGRAASDHRLIATTVVPGTGWRVEATVATGTVVEVFDRMATAAAGSIVLAFGASLLVAFAVWQQQAVAAALLELAQRRRAQEAETLYKATFDGVGMGIVHVSCEGTGIHSNPAFAAILGRGTEELAPFRVEEMFPEEERAEVLAELDRLIRGEVPSLSGQRRLVRGDGRLVDVSVVATLAHTRDSTFVVATVEDITRRVEAERQLKRMETSRRLESLGRMTGGIAHDFNNLLTVISGNLQLLEMSPQSPSAGRWISEALRATETGAKLNNRLTSFARERRLTAVVTDLGERIAALGELIHRTIGPSVALTIEVGVVPSIALVDPTEIDNAVLNLVFNARDAMPSGGSLTIRVDNVVISEAIGVAEAETGDFVRISVTDTGQGMTPEVQARAFEPFFTTKESGRGTGLGLSTLHGFVRQSGGFVGLESTVGVGTTIRVFLPRVIGRLPPERPHFDEPPRGHGERILVVEDDPDVRRVTGERLAALGYVIGEAQDVRAGLTRLGSGEHWDLVFSDVMMPGGLSGVDLVRRLAETMPDQRVLLTSGHADDFDRPDDPRGPGAPVLRKPYSSLQLATAIRTALDRGPG